MKKYDKKKKELVAKSNANVDKKLSSSNRHEQMKRTFENSPADKKK